jgi:hypothetical protein
MLEGINWLAALVAAVAAYLMGAVWYMPKVFGDAWLAELGKKPEDLTNPTLPMLVAAATTPLTSVCLAFLLRGLGVQTVGGGLVFGIVIGGGIVFASMLSDYMFQDKPMKLLWIQGGYRFCSILLICTVVGAWP